MSGPPESAFRAGVGDALVAALLAPPDRDVPAVRARERRRPAAADHEAARDATLLRTHGEHGPGRQRMGLLNPCDLRDHDYYRLTPILVSVPGTAGRLGRNVYVPAVVCDELACPPSRSGPVAQLGWTCHAGRP